MNEEVVGVVDIARVAIDPELTLKLVDPKLVVELLFKLVIVSLTEDVKELGDRVEEVTTDSKLPPNDEAVELISDVVV